MTKRNLTELIVSCLEDGEMESLDGVRDKLSAHRVTDNDIDMFLSLEFPNGCYARKLLISTGLYNVVRVGNFLSRRAC